MIRSVEKELIYGLLEMCTKENLIMMKDMEKEK